MARLRHCVTISERSTTILKQLEKHSVTIDKHFQELSVKDQILQLNAAVVALAQKEDISLPR